jgi:hypothetical protein
MLMKIFLNPTSQTLPAPSILDKWFSTHTVTDSTSKAGHVPRRGDYPVEIGENEIAESWDEGKKERKGGSF